MNELTGQDRKRLTEFLDKCWHEPEEDYFGGNSHICPKCENLWLPRIGNRTFITWQDFGDLKDKLVEKEEWGKFHIFAADIFWLEPILEPIKEINDTYDSYDSDFEDWLINVPRFCWLVNKYLKEKEAKP